MLPRAIEEVRQQGVAYTDEEGDLVTTILDGRNCAFTCYAPGGVCLCALEKPSGKGAPGLGNLHRVRFIRCV